MILRVTREYNTTCIGGHMDVDGAAFGVTLERHWEDNHHGVSAIPAGIYAVGITYSQKFDRPMLEILNVPDRAGIRIHNANYYQQLLGCIAVARRRLDPEHIYGGLADVLQKMVEQAGGAEIEIVNAWEAAKK